MEYVITIVKKTKQKKTVMTCVVVAVFVCIKSNNIKIPMITYLVVPLSHNLFKALIG